MKMISRAKIASTDTHYLHHIHAGRYDLQTDEPVVLGGQGQGPAPFDLYLASLSACTAITLRMYAERKGWDWVNSPPSSKRRWTMTAICTSIASCMPPARWTKRNGRACSKSSPIHRSPK